MYQFNKWINVLAFQVFIGIAWFFRSCKRPNTWERGCTSKYDLPSRSSRSSSLCVPTGSRRYRTRFRSFDLCTHFTDQSNFPVTRCYGSRFVQERTRRAKNSLLRFYVRYDCATLITPLLLRFFSFSFFFLFFFKPRSFVDTYGRLVSNFAGVYMYLDVFLFSSFFSLSVSVCRCFLISVFFCFLCGNANASTFCFCYAVD